MNAPDSTRNSNSSWVFLLTLCIAWAVALVFFQEFVAARLKLARPDSALRWTIVATQEDPFEKEYPEDSGFYRLYPDKHVAWDSGFFLSIASSGYDDPIMGRVEIGDGQQISKSYAFMPLYPWLIQVSVDLLENLFLPTNNQTPVSVAMLIGFLGTIAAVLSLADLVKWGNGNQADSERAVFYFLIFPVSFFLIQVYTEGFFIGLAFSCLASLRHRKWLIASILAGLAFLTRTIGIGLIIPIITVIFYDSNFQKQNHTIERKDLWIKFISILVPLAIFAAWYVSPLGRNFFLVEQNFFGRQAFAFEKSWLNWSNVFAGLGRNPQNTAYYILEISSIGLTFISCIRTADLYLPESLFGLFVIIISIFSGIPQSMFRYMLIVPNIFIFLGSLGRYKIFDRAWTILSIFLLAVQLTLFTFDLWVG